MQIILLSLALIAAVNSQTSPPPIDPNNPNCGRPIIAPIEDAPFDANGNKIVGGFEVIPGSWPWQLSLRVSFGGTSSFHNCGASIINNWWIMTAAHCVTNTTPSRYRIHAGAHSRDSTSPDVEPNLQIRTPSKVIPHPSYNSRTIDYDIAVLKMAEPWNFTTYVQPVCLPSYDVIDNENCYITGWGNTQGSGFEGVCKQAWVPNVPQAKCKQPDFYGPTAITDRMFCAGFDEGGVDTCQGDSGGPVACKRPNGQFQLNGLTSWGQGCALPKKPGVYARVHHLMPWVNAVISAN